MLISKVVYFLLLGCLIQKAEAGFFPYRSLAGCADPNGCPPPDPEDECDCEDRGVLPDGTVGYATREECVCAVCPRCDAPDGCVLASSYYSCPAPQPEPVPQPQPEPVDPEMTGDPHLKSWKGDWFDYHGQCDLKLMHVPSLNGKQEMDIHVRTTIRYDYSYIEAAALRIGDDILEVGSFGTYSLNGVERAFNPNGHGLPTIGGYPIVHSQVNEKKFAFDVVIGTNQNITITTFKDWVGVRIVNGDETTFGGVSGLMGSYDGKMLSRDGSDLSDDIVALGQDWQVQEDEPMLFRTVRSPQAPQKCLLPNPHAKVTRRLGEGIAQEAAEKACAHLNGHAFKFCVNDIMVSGDLDAAHNLDF